jgi:hypothetical protein
MILGEIIKGCSAWKRGKGIVFMFSGDKLFE